MSPETVKSVTIADSAIKTWRTHIRISVLFAVLNFELGFWNGLNAYAGSHWSLFFVSAFSIGAGFWILRGCSTAKKKCKQWQKIRQLNMQMDAAQTLSAKQCILDQLCATLSDT